MPGRANSLALALGLCLCLGLAGLGGARSTQEFGGSSEMGDIDHSGGDEHPPTSTRSSDDTPAYKGAPQQQQQQKGTSPASPAAKYPSPVAPANNKGELAPIFNLSEYAQLIFSPFELVKKISETFKLPQDKFVEKIGKGLIFGAESMLTPLIASLKIIEKVFVPDHCRLKLLCQVGSRFNFAKETILKFSPNLLHGSAHLKAITDGMTGQNCDLVFKDCEPKLKRPYEDLKGQAGQQQQPQQQQQQQQQQL